MSPTQPAPRPRHSLVVLLVIAAAAVTFLERVWLPHAWGEPASMTRVFYYVFKSLAPARGQPLS